MSITRPKVTLIRGDGSFPPPQIRKIYPDRALLWKYFLKAFIVWLLALSALVVSTTFFIAIDSTEINPTFISNPEFQVFSFALFFVLTLVIGPLVIVFLVLYVRSMEFIVHGDEIIVRKGLFNISIKYCPFRTITNISTEVGVFDRLFDIGCINIQTSGASGPSGGRSEEKLEGLRVYHEIREYIIAQIRLVGREGSPSKDILQKTILEELALVKRGFGDFKRKNKR